MAEKKLYTEIRIIHDSAEEKELFEKNIKQQAKSITHGNVRAYVRLIVSLDSASGIIKKLQSESK